MDGYARFLSLQAAFHLRCERALDGRRFERLLPDWPQRRRWHLAVADCRALGVCLGDSEPAEPLTVETDDHALGVAYVLEGSTLGGAVLAERVRGAGFPGCVNVRFLESYGSDRSLMWRCFQDILGDHLSTPASVDRAAAGALETFDLFIRLAGSADGQPEVGTR